MQLRKLIFLIPIVALVVILATLLPKKSPLPKKPKPTTLAQSQPTHIYGKVFSHGLRSKHYVSVTLDADMTPKMINDLKRGVVSSWYNKPVIETLEKENVPATIFVTGLWAKTYPDVVHGLAQNPLFEIGNHSYSHPAFARSCFKLSPLTNEDQKNLEFKLSQEEITKDAGYAPTLFRFPGGCFLPSDINLAGKYGLTVIGWDAASGDAFNPNVNQIVASEEKYIQNGSILLFHLHGNRNAPVSDKALPIVIKYLKEKGFQFVKVSEMIKDAETNS